MFWFRYFHKLEFKKNYSKKVKWTVSCIINKYFFLDENKFEKKRKRLIIMRRIRTLYSFRFVKNHIYKIENSLFIIFSIIYFSSYGSPFFISFIIINAYNESILVDFGNLNTCSLEVFLYIRFDIYKQNCKI